MTNIPKFNSFSQYEETSRVEEVFFSDALRAQKQLNLFQTVM